MSVRELLATLSSAELVSLVATDPDLEYAFRHALLQDAAYDLLLKHERKALHSTVGTALEQLYPERRDELAAVLAYHFEQAGERDRAVEYLVRAGRHALARFANREARELLDRAARHLEEIGRADPATCVDVALGRVQAGFSFIPFDENLALLEDALFGAEEIGDPRLLARAHLLIGRVRSGQGESYVTSEALRRSLDEALRLGSELDDHRVRATPLMLIGNARFDTGDYAGAIEALEEARTLLERFEDHADAALATANLARAHARSGDFPAARAAARRAAEHADRSGDPNVVLDVRILRGIVAAEQGDLEEAERLTAKGVALADAVGNTYCSLVGNFYLGDQQLRQGRPDDAIASLERSQGLAEFCDAGSMLSLSGAWLGAARAHRGEDTVASFAGPVARAHASGDRYAEALVLQLRADARLAQDERDGEGAVEDLETAAGLLEALGARPALARVLAHLGRAMRVAGRHDEALESEHRAEELAAAVELLVESAAPR